MRLQVITAIFISLCLAANAQSETITVSGDVSGSWSADTVLVEADIRVPVDMSLTIDPGVLVLFQGHFKLTVDTSASLMAIGSPTDSITFTKQDVYWASIRLINAADCSLKYCSISYSQADEPGTYGDHGGGVFSQNSPAYIGHSLITYCSAYRGGCIDVEDSSTAVIEYNIIENSSGSNSGSGLHCYESKSIIIRGNIIRNCSSSWMGGGFYAYECDSITFVENIVADNYSWYGGGMSCGSDVGRYLLIDGNLIINNSSIGFGDGGGIDRAWDGIVTNNIFKGNFGGYGGGINSGAVIVGNVFIGNSANNQGGGICTGGSAIVSRNLMCDNTATGAAGGGGVGIQSGSVSMANNTIVYNHHPSGPGGVGVNYDGNFSMANNIVWGNEVNQIGNLGSNVPYVIYSDIQDTVWWGPGNIDEDPLFVNPALNDYRLTWESPCIDEGSPDPDYWDPDGTVNDMGAFYFDQSVPVRILLSPHDIPYLVGASGRTIDYTIRVENIDTVPLEMTIWCDVTLPDGTIYGPLTGPVMATIGGGQVVERLRTQTVPGIAPAGIYSYNAYAVVDQDTSKDSFKFGKMGVTSGGSTSWGVAGDLFVEDNFSNSSEGVIKEYRLNDPYPNPFNPTTNISFAIPKSTFIQLSVYDLQGKLVSELINGIRQAGYHEITFDASDLASGMYFYKFEAGEFTAVKKMVFVK